MRSDVAPYSAFSTSIGSTRTARLTGSAEAAKHVANDTNTVTVSTNGSVGSTPLNAQGKETPSFLPATRAASVDPARLLREE